ncbi:hypothetical protein ACFW2Y_12170 [Streptomyces sp. NPDC058877]|uniref:hypothetical protein n=1 Tax=unclassified Streptomyces TaxID=2593676 RepID=UPI0036D0491D
MNRWTAYGAIIAGVVLLALYVSDTITTTPYSTFAILAGTGLVVDGIRRLYHLRRSRNPQNP